MKELCNKNGSKTGQLKKNTQIIQSPHWYT